MPRNLAVALRKRSNDLGGGSRHQVQFYEDDAFLAETVARFIGAGLGAGGGSIVIATPQHRADVEQRLRAGGLDLDLARAQGRYVSLDAAETLARFAPGGMIDEERFAHVVGEVIARVASAGAPQRVHAFGEMVALLWAEGRRDAALRLEDAWNDLARTLPFSLLCGYPLGAFGSESDAASFREVCGRHARVVPAEGYSALADENERERAITELQQKARALETEVEQRRHAEEALRERNETLRALIGASPLPIVVIDPDTTVRLWNPAAERVFGWSEPEVIGRPMPIVPPEKVTECAGVRDAVVDGETFLGVQTYRRRRDGTVIELLISAAPLRDRQGTVHAIVLLFEDVTERNRTEAARQRTLRELTTLYQMGRTLSAELDIERLLQALTDAATQLSGAKFGAFFYNATDDQGDHYLLYTLSGASREAFDKFGMPRNTKVFGPTFAGVGVIRLHDVTKDSRYGQNAPHFGMPAGHLPVTSYLAVPVVGRTGEVFGGLFLGHPEPGVFTDESERVVVGLAAQAAVAIDNARLYDAERRARGDAEAANRAKDEFLAMLGHELRNPLSAVRNAVVTARLDPTRRDRALDIARHGTDQLGRLVDDLLDVARITQGRIALRTQRLPFASIVERAVESTRRLIEERAHTITVSLPGTDPQVEADSTRMEQVIGNLLSNAAKYTDPGGRIAVTATQEGGEAVLRVRDDGMGIAPTMLRRVFDLFAQADRCLDRAQGGLGIGLTVVKRLVELHGGRVEARSEGIGKGAEFVVRLPAVTAPPETAVETPSSHGLARGCARILLVEDNADAAESLMMLLELLGHRVRVVYDGPTALETARASTPDVMLVDIGLPGMDGYEVARQVRETPELRSVVLVALTGYGRDEDRQRALAAGFDYHLVKPVNPDALQGLVAQFPSDPTPPKGPTVH